jgi:hypothetical protein
MTKNIQQPSNDPSGRVSICYLSFVISFEPQARMTLPLGSEHFPKLLNLVLGESPNLMSMESQHQLRGFL